MWEFDTEFSEIIQRTPEVKSFRFPISSREAPYVAGQYFFITMKVKGVDAVHHFSFSCSPTDETYLEFTKRITASDFSQALNAARPGDKAHLQGPFGSFTLPDEAQPLGFVSGGIGITPLRSMLRYIDARKLAYNVVLIYGSRTYEDIVFRDELQDLEQSHSNLSVKYVLSGPGIPADWKGKTGFINRDIVRELVPDFDKRLFYISGPPGMVMALEKEIIALGVSQQRVKKDSFTGYD